VHILPFNKAGFLEPLVERGNQACPFGRYAGTKEPDHRHRRLLRPRRERPRGCRAAEQRDEFAAFHSITSSARRMNDFPGL
jgi:hypothetical protein